MAQITLEAPDELVAQLHQLGDRLTEWLTLSLSQPALPARLYRDIIRFLASQPTPEQIIEFKAPSEIQERIRVLLERNRENDLTPTEEAELDEYEQIEHFIILLKANALKSSPRS